MTNPKQLMKGMQCDDLSIISYPKIVQPKIDGFRVYVRHDNIPISPNFKPVRNRYICEWFKARPWYAGLDGELVVGPASDPNVYERTSREATTHDGEPDFTFHVFDVFDPDKIKMETLTYSDRLKIARNRVLYGYYRIKATASPRSDLTRVVMINYTTYALDIEQLEQRIEQNTGSGYEGTMIRDPYGLYKQGRSTLKQQGLLKIKAFHTHEARVLSYNEATDEHGIPKRMVGSINAIGLNGPYEGKEFVVGAGCLSHDMRTALFKKQQYEQAYSVMAEAWKDVHTDFEYKHQVHSAHYQLPRTPTFYRWRDE